METIDSQPRVNIKLFVFQKLRNKNGASLRTQTSTAVTDLLFTVSSMMAAVNKATYNNIIKLQSLSKYTSLQFVTQTI
jgi:hypothetical protein